MKRPFGFSFLINTALIAMIGSSTLLSCGKIKNTSSSDKALYGLTNQGSTQFKLAFTIFARSCLSCHSGWSNYNETDFITNGLVIANDITLSPIYYRILNNDSGIAGDMPLGASPLTADDIAIIKTWVQIAN